MNRLALRLRSSNQSSNRLAALGAVIAFFAAGPALAAEPVIVELKDAATVRNRAICVGDVANLKDGDPSVRNRIAGVELAEAPALGQSVTVKARQLEFRLLLADFPRSSFRVTGSSEAIVTTARDSISVEAIQNAAREALVRRLPWPAEDLSIKQVRPVALQLPQVADWETPIIKAVPHSSSVGMGRCQIDVSIYVNGERRLSLPVYFETNLLQKVAVCRTPVKKGEALTEKNVYADRRPFDSGVRTIIPYESVIGRKASRAMLPGQLVSSLELEPEQAAESSAVVHARQPVKMQVRVGTMNLVATGEALQEGKVGQLIRVQNLDSKKVVAGRVTGPGAVEVESGGNP